MSRPSRKQSIIDHATLIFAGKGFATTSMSEVAALADTAGATIFYHFKSKEELFIAVLENAKNGILGEFSAYLQHNRFATGLDRLLGSIAFHLHLSETRKEWFLLLQQPYTHELAALNNTCRDHLHDIYSCLIDILEKALQQGMQDGSIRKLSASKSALIILATIDGLCHLENNKLYSASSLYAELLELCRSMVASS